MDEIAILNVKKIEGKKQLRAFVDVSMGHITIHGIRLMDDGKGFWLGFPQVSYEKNGKTHYSPIVEVTEILKKHLREAIVTAYEDAEEEPDENDK